MKITLFTLLLLSHTLLVEASVSLETAVQEALTLWQQGRSQQERAAFQQARDKLAPWWQTTQIQANPRFYYVRGLLHYEYRDLSAAAQDLSRYLEQEPDTAPYHVQAWLTLATVQRLQGNYPQAQDSCQTLTLYGGEMVGGLCRSQVLGLLGRTEQALWWLENISYNAYSAGKRHYGWVLGEWIALLLRLGLLEKATERYQHLADYTQPNAYAQRQYADVLLQQENYNAVLQLIPKIDVAPELVFRRAFALKQLGQALKSELDVLQAEIQGRAEQGDNSLALLNIYTQLFLLDEQEAAVPNAQRLWTQQKTPDVAAVLYFADSNPDAKNSVQTWAKQHHWPAVFLGVSFLPSKH